MHTNFCSTNLIAVRIYSSNVDVFLLLYNFIYHDTLIKRLTYNSILLKVGASIIGDHANMKRFSILDVIYQNDTFAVYLKASTEVFYDNHWYNQYILWEMYYFRNFM